MLFLNICWQGFLIPEFPVRSRWPHNILAGNEPGVDAGWYTGQSARLLIGGLAPVIQPPGCAGAGSPRQRPRRPPGRLADGAGCASRSLRRDHSDTVLGMD